MPEGRCGKSSGTLNEIKSVTKCYGGEVCRKKDGLLSFHKSSEQSQLESFSESKSSSGADEERPSSLGSRLILKVSYILISF